MAADNVTGTDSHGQIVAHRTWNGTGAAWSAPVLDVAGSTTVGAGRPGMPTVVPTSDGKWLMTYEYWGGGDNVRYKVAASPLSFFSVGGAAGTGVGSLPVTAGSGAVAQGGSPVLTRLPNGRIRLGERVRVEHRRVGAGQHQLGRVLQPRPDLPAGQRPGRGDRRHRHHPVRRRRLRQLGRRVRQAGQPQER